MPVPRRPTQAMESRVPGRLTSRAGFAALVLVLCLLTASCTSASPASGSAPQVSGGILRVGVLTDALTENFYSSCVFTFSGAAGDPQFNASSQSLLFELDRCCLMRSLLSYNGRDISDGGATLRPDLATSLPDVSSDGLTWTFHLRQGIHYGPPLQSETVTAQDFVRSLERILSPAPAWMPDQGAGGSYLDDYLGTYLQLAQAIKGATAYGAAKEQHISGLETPDQHTLVLHLTRASGNLGYLLAMPGIGPIPPIPSHPEWRFGAAQGHDRVYSSYVVSTGPYMIEGSPQLDFSKPPQLQLPASGDAPSSLTLVRNPEWNPGSDPLRAALPDRIELVPVKDETAAKPLIRRGSIDFAFNWIAPPGLLSGSVSPPRPEDQLFSISMNLAMPPLDDVHVRRAINFAIPRQPLLHLWDKAHRTGISATHIGLDDQENNLLVNFDPFHAATGDLKAAKREMAKSRYDSNHDGRCDASACSGIDFWVRGVHPEQARTAHRVARDLARIGVRLRLRLVDDTRFDSIDSPENHVQMILNGWLKDTLSPGPYFAPQFGGAPLQPMHTLDNNYNNVTLVGATHAELKSWGYRVTHVPSVDDRLRQCFPETFAQQVQCFAAFDQYLTAEVVPMVPLISRVTGRVTSSDVSRINFEPAPVNPVPALDRVVLRPDAKSPPLPGVPHPVSSIPNGVYRYKLVNADVHRIPLVFDVPENTGTRTVYLRDGRFESVLHANHPIVNPITTGTYTGTGHNVTFKVLEPSLSAMTTPQAKWSFDRHALHFKLSSCGKLGRLYPRAPGLICKDIRAVYEAHPWVKVANLP
ncbi:MAG: peptide/nickel transport system substrate-binding protein [Actinomycetota bacterium]|nr:peptide/nickel transport system substrate-binding protein [Actinomycetota bacterium]